MDENVRVRRFKRAVYIAAPLFIFIVTYIMVMKEARLEKASDVVAHMKKCLSLEEVMSVSDNGWHIICYLIYELMPVSIETAASITSALFNAFEAVIIVWLANFMLKPDYRRSESFWLVSFISASSLLVGPLYLRFFNPRYYYGQSSPNPWHSPTTTAVKPFALLISIVTAFYWQCDPGEVVKVGKRQMKKTTVYQIWLAVLLLVSTLIKPSILTIYFPLCFFAALIKLIRQKGHGFFKLIGQHLYFLPSAALFLVQYLKIYVMKGSASAETTGGIEIALFKVAKMASPCFPVSVILRMAFPFAVVIIWRKTVFKDKLFNICFWQYILGLLVFWTFAETGTRASHGNFGWGNVIGSSLLWIWCVIYFFKRWREEKPGEQKGAAIKLKFAVPAFLLGLHLCDGIIYYFNLLHNMAGQL